jgi:ferredoxin, 2Fe-2S
MRQLHLTDREGRTHTLPAADGGSLMEALRAADVGVAALCGGAMSCATCHVYVDDEAGPLWPPGDDEAAMTAALASHQPGRSRLACQVHIDRPGLPLRVTIAPEE